MRKINVGGIEMPAEITTWAVDEFYRLTGINLYDEAGITKVFKKYGDDEKLTPPDFQVIAKLAYCALAAGCMPEDAGDDWKPPFTWRSIMNKYKMTDSRIYADLLSVYYDQDSSEIINAIEKNIEAPQVTGQE